LAYGAHTFLFGWLDTPYDNTPREIHGSFIPILFNILSHLMPEVIDLFFTQALNNHLGTSGLSIIEIAGEAARRGLTIEEVMALPEL
jgi:hypothetical protein